MEIKLERLKSLDILRGFAMFWIIGGHKLVHSLAEATDWELLNIFADQLSHAKWNGFTFFDLIFPLFMFVSGVTMPFSIGKSLEKGISRSKLLIKVTKRALILVLFGIIYNNQISFDFENLRYASVLGQIGIAYFIAAFIYIYTDRKGQIIWTISILLGYWAVMTLIPVPNIGAGVLTPEGNFSGYIDRLLLPGTLYRGDYDPQGIMLMISSTTITLMGAVTGKLLICDKYTKVRKTLFMTITGGSLIAVSLIWNIWYPINKEIWSSSFNTLTIGLSLLFLSVSYFIIDIKGYSKWAYPFMLIGTNSITIYMAYRMIYLQYTAQFLLTGVISISGDFANTIIALGILGLELALLHFMYKKKIFLKI